MSGSNELPIILGSSSKWRQQVLKDLGFEFSVMSPDIDEKAIRHPDPQQLPLLIARAKAEALIPKVATPSILITSDQIVVCNGVIREKPVDENECREYLRSYAHHPASCVTAVVVTNTKTGKSFEGVDTATQHFHPIPEDFMTKLIEQGDVMWCCGGFTIEHMEPYLSKLEGEKECITGLPKSLTLKLIEQAKTN